MGETAVKTADFRDYAAASGDCIRIRPDSVEGARKDRKHILTLMLPDMNFRVGFLCDKEGEAAAVTAKVTEGLSELGKHTDRPFAVLSDNGPESDALCTAESRAEGTHVFCADPCRSNDRAECGRRHELLRRFTPKGKSLEGPTQETPDGWLSHINSYQTEKTKRSKPAMLVAKACSMNFLDYLHIEIISDEDVRLKL